MEVAVVEKEAVTVAVAARHLRALGAERVLEQVIAGEQLELVVLDGGAEEDEEGVEERERPQPPDDHLEVEVVVRW